MELAVGLIGVLVGAAITFAFEWWATPKVQQRIRAEQRTEETLYSIYKLLTETVPDVFSHYVVLSRLAYRHTEKFTDEERERHKSDLEEKQTELGAMLQELRTAVRITGTHVGTPLSEYLEFLPPLIMREHRKSLGEDLPDEWDDEERYREAALAYLGERLGP